MLLIENNIEIMKLLINRKCEVVILMMCLRHLPPGMPLG